MGNPAHDQDQDKAKLSYSFKFISQQLVHPVILRGHKGVRPQGTRPSVIVVTVMWSFPIPVAKPDYTP